jgi:dienelactone hydrolase
MIDIVGHRYRGGGLRLFAAAFLAFACAFGPARADEGPSIAPGASMNEQVLSVPGDDQRPAMLQVTVLKPDGPGPFPLVVMNHGAAATARPDLEPRYRFTFSAYYFLSRGYAVALPMMRGFAGSEGRQNLAGCNQEAVGRANARDIAAVVDFMSGQPYVDGNRVVVAGQSFGGWNTLAFGSLSHPKVRGLINFAGGAKISNCGATESTLALGAEHFGARTSVPSLWFYGDNDSKFPPSVWQAMFERYTAAGGRAELVAYGPFMADSHNMLGYPEGLRIWAPKVDAFLATLGLPNRITNPEYLPTDFPPPTQFAAVDDVDAVPYLTDAGRQAYRKFLADPMPKVFVFSPTGLAGSFNGGFDPLGRAMSACQKNAQKCQVYAADDHVVWARPTPAPAPTHFAPIDDSSAIPYLNDGGRQGYQKYLALRKPKAFVVAPDGAWAAVALGDDPLSGAMGACGKAHQGCQLYAVDDEVVWRGK